MLKVLRKIGLTEIVLKLHCIFLECESLALKTSITSTSAHDFGEILILSTSVYKPTLDRKQRTVTFNKSFVHLLNETYIIEIH